MKRYMFNWIGGGFNDVRAKNLKEAIKKANEMFDGSDGHAKLIADENSFREWSAKESDKMCEIYFID